MRESMRRVLDLIGFTGKEPLSESEKPSRMQKNENLPKIERDKLDQMQEVRKSRKTD